MSNQIYLMLRIVGIPPKVIMYDSLYSTVAEDVKLQISSLLCSKEESIILEFVNLVKQSGVMIAGCLQ